MVDNGASSVAGRLKRRTQACVLVLDGERVALCHGATTTIVGRDDIILAESERNVTRIITGDEAFCVHAPFHSVLKRLTEVGMIQVHRRVAVNPRKVRQLVGRGQHRLLMLLNDGRSVSVGRNYQSHVKRQFGATLQK